MLPELLITRTCMVAGSISGLSTEEKETSIPLKALMLLPASFSVSKNSGFAFKNTSCSSKFDKVEEIG